jgi:protein-disulfide isomerase
MRKFYETHKKDTRFAFVEFPIKGENSEFAARAAIAARKQPDKYLKFHFLMMGEHELVTPEVVFADAKKAGLDLGKLSADMKDPSVDKAIKAAHALAEKTGINATPTFILNGRVRPGAIDDKMLTQMLES